MPFLRLSWGKLKPGSWDEFEKHYNEEVAPKASTVKGLQVRALLPSSDIPDEGLESGDVGTAVHVHHNGASYEVEFMTLTGDTVAVATVLPSQLRPVSRKDIAHVRELATHSPG